VSWHWAGTEENHRTDPLDEPDVVLACAGDVPTLETLAAAAWLREHVPELKTRVVNIVDLMTLFPRYFHPHGTTPFDMVVLNGMSRYHLATEAIKRTRAIYPRSEVLLAELQASIAQAVQYSKDHFEDLPEISDWRWKP
jgi:xylulose-5-phosphate/fructose-6-phosphate phosphoketolase